MGLQIFLTFSEIKVNSYQHNRPLTLYKTNIVSATGRSDVKSLYALTSTWQCDSLQVRQWEQLLLWVWQVWGAGDDGHRGQEGAQWLCASGEISDHHDDALVTMLGPNVNPIDTASPMNIFSLCHLSTEISFHAVKKLLWEENAIPSSLMYHCAKYIRNR